MHSKSEANFSSFTFPSHLYYVSFRVQRQSHEIVETHKFLQICIFSQIKVSRMEIPEIKSPRGQSSSQSTSSLSQSPIASTGNTFTVGAPQRLTFCRIHIPRETEILWGLITSTAAEIALWTNSDPVYPKGMISPKILRIFSHDCACKIEVRSVFGWTGIPLTHSGIPFTHHNFGQMWMTPERHWGLRRVQVFQRRHTQKPSGNKTYSVTNTNSSLMQTHIHRQTKDWLLLHLTHYTTSHPLHNTRSTWSLQDSLPRLPIPSLKYV